MSCRLIPAADQLLHLDVCNKPELEGRGAPTVGAAPHLPLNSACPSGIKSIDDTCQQMGWVREYQRPHLQLLLDNRYTIHEFITTLEPFYGTMAPAIVGHFRLCHDLHDFYGRLLRYFNGYLPPLPSSAYKRK